MPGDLHAGLLPEQRPAPEHGQRVDPGGEDVGVLGDLVVGHFAYAFDEQGHGYLGYLGHGRPPSSVERCRFISAAVSTLPPDFTGKRSTSSTLIAGEKDRTTASIRE